MTEEAPARRTRKKGEPKTFKCSGCPSEKESKTGVLPRGWKLHPTDSPWCDGCWNKTWTVRALTIPVAEPMYRYSGRRPAAENREEAPWKALRPVLSAAFGGATRLSNWAVRELAKAEPAVPKGEKLPAMASNYLYTHAREVAPELTPASTVSILNRVTRNYRARRFETIARNSISLPSYRYPTPVSWGAPKNGGGWEVIELEDGRPAIDVLLGGQHWVLRLRQGDGFRAQVEAALTLREGVAGGLPIELTLLEQRANTSDHRPVATERPQTRLMAKIVAWWPKRPVKEALGKLHVRTGPGAMWHYRMGSASEEERYHGGDVLQQVAAHRARLQKASDDLKLEIRSRRANMERVLEGRVPWLAKYRNRMSTWVQQSAAVIVGYAERRRAGTLVYDDRDHSWGDVQWHALATRIGVLCHERNIAFERVGHEEQDGPAREDTTEDQPQG